ncbi:hypothetical protein KUL10_05970 [Glaciecola sp. KUL10]|nr:hypothetical protein KUL10_05970 [Glaciecola sp. KUL10]
MRRSFIIVAFAGSAKFIIKQKFYNTELFCENGVVQMQKLMILTKPKIAGWTGPTVNKLLIFV